MQKQHAAGSGSQERLGRLLGSILEPFEGHVGPQDRSRRGSENELVLKLIFKRLLGGTSSCGRGSAGLRGAGAGPPGRARGGFVIL